mmetsp:Transcript_17829/g.49373  ORF Transcript_17829/g.49373 Transcript_17829/m.49373 type:complete len:213 (-) Transcript_17829:433-1071(-)
MASTGDDDDGWHGTRRMMVREQLGAEFLARAAGMCELIISRMVPPCVTTRIRRARWSSRPGHSPQPPVGLVGAECGRSRRLDSLAVLAMLSLLESDRDRSIPRESVAGISGEDRVLLAALASRTAAVLVVGAGLPGRASFDPAEFVEWLEIIFVTNDLVRSATSSQDSPFFGLNFRTDTPSLFAILSHVPKGFPSRAPAPFSRSKSSRTAYG